MGEAGEMLGGYRPREEREEVGEMIGRCRPRERIGKAVGGG